MVRASSKPKRRPKFRASWKGQLRFGLVSFGVQAVNATVKEQGELHFHLLHSVCHSRIHYAKMCPVHGEVPNDEIIEGYEYGKDRYVEFSKEELDTLRSDREKALTIDTFIGPHEIDPVYFDGRMYYLIPAAASDAESYSVMQEAMQRQDRWGVGQVVFSGKEQLALVRPAGGLLQMAMLNYDAEIRKPAEFESEIVRPRTTPRKIKLAEDLIRNWTDAKFDFSQYEDRYREKAQRLVDAKIKGRDVVAPEEDEQPQVVNLMEALKQSVARAEHGRGNHAERNGSHARRAASGAKKTRRAAPAKKRRRAS